MEHSADDLEKLFDNLENLSGDTHEIVNAPFAYLGGKTKSIDHILPNLPYRNTYVEPFGGSAAVLLARRPSNLEVYNDRYGGVVAFYRVLRDRNLLDQLIEKMELSIHNREDFVWFKETWENVSDPVERAFRWLYLNVTSFGSLCREWGRTRTGREQIAHKWMRKIPKLQQVHERFRTVQVENRDWYLCLKDYDSSDTVFYIDPPYLGGWGYPGGAFTHDEHKSLLQTIQNLSGFVALSGFSNPLYEAYDWDERYTWEVQASVGSTRNEGNFKDNITTTRHKQEEVLWIKR